MAWSSEISHVAVDVQFGIGFVIGHGKLPWQPILGTKLAEIGHTPSFLGLAFHNGRQHGKADRLINTIDVLSTSHKNLVICGPLTPEFMVIIRQPFRRQWAKSAKRVHSHSTMDGRSRWTDLCQIHMEDVFGPLLGRDGMSRSKVKDQGQQGQKNALCTHNTPSIDWLEQWNVLTANNVTQAADTTILSLRRVSSPGCVRWAWRDTAALCHAFLVQCCNNYHIFCNHQTKIMMPHDAKLQKH